ncbi:MAG: homoserine dehydrogenase [Bacteroidota bacterium]
MHYRLVFIGFGNVGRCLARLLLRKRGLLESDYAVRFSATGIATGRHGCAVNPDGLDLVQALELVEGGESLAPLSTVPVTDTMGVLEHSSGDVMFENSPVNHATGQPAVDHVRAALELGMHAITANKGTVVHGYRELSALAAAKGRRFLFESTVLGGSPVFSVFREALPAAELRSFKGIINATTNVILSRMERGETFEQAVAFCQSVGLAETDPSADIDGWDAAIKVAALITVLMDAPFTPQQVEREGIRGITAEMVKQAAAQGTRWKLVASAERRDGKISARVGPERLPASSPLYGMMDSSTGLTFRTDVLPDYSIVVSEREGMPGGPEETAYGLFADFLNAVRSH